MGKLKCSRKTGLIISAFVLLIIIFSILAGVLIFITKDFNTADINMADKSVIKVYADGSDAYYLTSDGTLYSPGADIDAGRYVSYKNQKAGIVGENVVDFGRMIRGGYYITSNNELWLWNTDDIPALNYKANKQAKISDDVIFVKSDGAYALIYIDKLGNLYLRGEFNQAVYTAENPKLLASNVRAADITENLIVWLSDENEFGFFGTLGDWCDFNDLKTAGVDFNKDITLSANADYLLILQGSKLWYYGDYGKITGKQETVAADMVLLSDSAASYACDREKIVVINNDEAAYFWGKYFCVTDGGERNDRYFENEKITDGVISVTVNRDYIGFASKDYRSKVFGISDVWQFCGNSVRPEEYIGLNSTPITWVKTEETGD